MECPNLQSGAKEKDIALKRAAISASPFWGLAKMPRMP